MKLCIFEMDNALLFAKCNCMLFSLIIISNNSIKLFLWEIFFGNLYVPRIEVYILS